LYLKIFQQSSYDHSSGCVAFSTKLILKNCDDFCVISSVLK
jgi:hypothetical protein